MKNLIRIAVAALMVMMTASCAKEVFVNENEEPANGNLVPATFTATIESGKANLDGTKVCWNSGDKIAVFDGVEKREFTVVSCESNTATFCGEMEEGAISVYAIYPYDVATGVEDGVMSFNIPATQVVAENGDLDESALVMVGKAEDDVITFKNIVSLAKVSIDKENIESVTLTANGGEKICGKATAEEDAVATCTGAAAVTLYPDGDTFEKGDYYVALAPATATKGIFVQCTDADGGKIFRNTDKAVSFVRSHILPLGKVSAGEVIPNPIMNFDQLKLWAKYAIKYETSDVVKLGADIDMKGETWTPVARYNAGFDGQGHSILNMKISDAVCASFIYINYGVFKNVTFGAKTGDNSEIVLLGPAAGATYAGIIGATAGNVENVTSYVSISSPNTLKSQPLVGGIVGRLNAAKVSGCTNYGSIDIAGAPSSEYAAAGIVGYATNAAGTIDNCKNYGAVTVSMPKVTVAPNVGGIVAKGLTSVTNCSNYGDVSFFFTSTKAADSGKSTIIGGVAGNLYPAATASISVKNCTNEGQVYCDNDRAKIIGGVIGQITSGTVTVESCVNKGAVCANAPSAANWNDVGGIVGRAVGASNIIKNCTNEGDVDFVCGSTNEASGAAGIAGCTTVATLSGNVNKGNISATNTLASGGYVVAAGIIAIPSNQVVCSVTGDQNFGEISAWGNKTAGIKAGGIIGSPWNSDKVTVTSAVNNGDVSSDGVAGALLGSETAVSASKSYTVTFNNCQVACSVNGVEITADNMAGLLAGAATKSVFNNTTLYTK